MIIKWLIFLSALIAHVWLWERWTFAASMHFTLALIVASVLAITMIAVPIRSMIHKHSPMKPFSSYWMQGVFYSYVILIIIISIYHFSGLIQLLLPIKVFLLALYVYLKFKLKGQFSSKQKVEDNQEIEKITDK